MEYTEKEVFFNEYCKKCKHKDTPQEALPCAECLDEPFNSNSHKPLYFEGKIDTENRRTKTLRLKKFMPSTYLPEYNDLLFKEGRNPRYNEFLDFYLELFVKNEKLRPLSAWQKFIK